jgi:hypothetical protein
MTTKVQIGSISEGTLRTVDLLEAFEAELERVSGGTYAELRDSAIRWINWLDEDHNDEGPDESSECLQELMDALNDHAPVHVSFGAHEGDGALFGWWPTNPAETCHTVDVDHERYVDIECGVLVEVNDHGNMTVRELGGETIWEAV